ncbi:MAG: YggS family pyridoxal phosphate-dependent enzyme [Candidatus Eremiobacteraeota bacterium]|nr:YggS family pyridoxal phosphate-dependent enzyme [Candidatus Eremiobacteraeota bacterium]
MDLALEASTDASTTVAARVQRLRDEVAEVARSANRDPAEIAIVAVSKLQPPSAVREAYDAGLRAFGENYVQEALAKFAGLPTDAERHFIGHIQTNKARALARGFDLVQSVDRLHAGVALAKAARAAGRRLRVLVQINVSPQERFGAAPSDAPALADELRAEGLEVAGTMAIGPLTNDARTIREAFLRAADAHERVGGTILSLGMSADWRVAVACGSTMIRVGTAIFGPRPLSKGDSSS